MLPQLIIEVSLELCKFMGARSIKVGFHGAYVWFLPFDRTSSLT
jgi:hypothetical protein